MGISLSPDFLLGRSRKEGYNSLLDLFGSPQHALAEFKDKGLTHVELRYIRPDGDAEAVLASAEVVWSAGLELTIHGKLADRTAQGSFARIYPSIAGVLSRFDQYQEQLVITIHAYSEKAGDAGALGDETVHTVCRWISLIEREGQPVHLALELKRSKDRVDPANTCEGVLGLVERVEDRRVGICWDAGHYYANVVHGGATVLPPWDFASRTIHTHLHGLGGKGTTHHAIATPESLPLERYVGLLRDTGYGGVYNLEFGFDRLGSGEKMAGALFSSMERLRSCNWEECKKVNSPPFPLIR